MGPGMIAFAPIRQLGDELLKGGGNCDERAPRGPMAPII